MKKFYFVFCFLLSAAGCASLPDKNPYTDENTVYKIEAVNVKFSSVCSVGDYDSEDEIRRQFNENIRQAFCASLPCAAAENNGEINTVAVTFDVFYRRVLMGEAFNCPSESYGNGLFKYGVKAVKKVKNENGKKEQVTVAALASDKENFISKGLVGNFMTIFQQWSFSAGKEEERREIKSISDVLVKKTVEKLR